MVLHTRPKRQQETRGPSKAAQAAEKAHMVLRRYYGGGVATALRVAAVWWRCGGGMAVVVRLCYDGAAPLDGCEREQHDIEREEEREARLGG